MIQKIIAAARCAVAFVVAVGAASRLPKLAATVAAAADAGRASIACAAAPTVRSHLLARVSA